MKKTKKISFRLSQKDYEIIVSDYLWCKKNPEWTKLIHETQIKSFSDYIRLMIQKGMNE